MGGGEHLLNNKTIKHAFVAEFRKIELTCISSWLLKNFLELTCLAM